jgi:hypothetical protein
MFSVAPNIVLIAVVGTISFQKMKKEHLITTQKSKVNQMVPSIPLHWPSWSRIWEVRMTCVVKMMPQLHG